MPTQRSPLRRSPRNQDPMSLGATAAADATDVNAATSASTGRPGTTASLASTAPASTARPTAAPADNDAATPAIASCSSATFADTATATPAIASSFTATPADTAVATPAIASSFTATPADTAVATPAIASCSSATFADIAATTPAMASRSPAMPADIAYHGAAAAPAIVSRVDNVAMFTSTPEGAASAYFVTPAIVAAATAAQQNSILYMMQRQIAALESQLESAHSRIAESEAERRRQQTVPVGTVLADACRSSGERVNGDNGRALTGFVGSADGHSPLGHTNNTYMQPPSTLSVSVPPQGMMYAPKKLLDLPEFSGRPEDWPVFYAAFTESTSIYNYSNFENNQRLNKCLKGAARETVKALLIHPSNVNVVIEQLHCRFGQPEQLIRSQLRAVRDAPVIPEGAMAKLIPFATLTKNLTAFLQSMQEDRHLANPILLEELVSKLPVSKRLDWARHAATIQPYATIAHFSDWLSTLANFVQMVHDTEPREPRRRTVLHAAEERRPVAAKCPICHGAHKPAECQRLVDATVSERWDKAKRTGLCFSCLNAGHSTRDCRRRRPCSVDGCMRYHHRLLHEGAATPRARSITVPEPNVLNTAVLSCSVEVHREFLFRVLPVTLYGPNKRVCTYALLDEGSSITMMDDSLLEELGLRGQQRRIDVQWYGNKTAQESVVVVNLQVSGRDIKKRHALRNVHAVSNLKLPLQSLREDEIPAAARHRGKLLIQPYLNVTPTILIGLDHCHLGLPTHAMRHSRRGPYAAHTELGWVVFGPSSNPSPRKPACLFVHSTPDQQLHEKMADYFNVESFGVRASPLVENAADLRAKKILEETTVKVDGRFQTCLLWKSDEIKLPESYGMAMQRLIGIERKMKREKKFAAAYCNIIEDYVVKKYARKLEPPEIVDSSQRMWYLPHFAVVNPHKPEKLRLVFDAAAAVNGVSLNSCLLKGPQEYRPLPAVLFHFREGAVGICADIKEMFHQILIQPEDRKAQRFLWRGGDSTKPPDVYEMTVMTFGAACSPCAADYVKRKNATEHHRNDPRAVKAIVDYHYVDDFVDSFSSAAEAIEISQQVREIHKDAGFELRKFSSNLPQVAAALGGGCSTALPITSKESLASEKVLGMVWQPSTDEFTYCLKFYGVDVAVVQGERVPTKRELLSIAMSIFDPLGFLCHFAINAKLLLRELWKRNVGWDEPVPSEVNAMWTLFKNQLNNVVECRIPRYYFQGGQPRELQLHVFVDASEEAFAAVAYWRAESECNAVGVSLVCAKTRSAPLKPLTIPRLELQAAVLGTRLMTAILAEHNLRVDRRVLWSDSTTVLKWIASEHRRYKPFVAHRVAEVLSVTQPSEWRWVPTGDNVADEATRVNRNVDLRPSSRWFSGPEFLLQDEKLWPAETVTSRSYEDEDELRPKFTLIVVSNDFINFNRFSSFTKLKRVAAWVIRFVNNCRKTSSPLCEYGLNAAELNTAEIILCRRVQQEAFANDIRLVERGVVLPRDSALYALTPYVDAEGLLRVKGRLDMASCLPYDTKRPIILPPRHTFTKLLVASVHCQMIHQNHEAAICQIRSKYWVANLRRVLRGVIASCVVCKAMKAKPAVPIMGPLPEDRLTPYVRPFTYTGLDYFGPICVTIGRRTEKRWVALFTCLTVRAIHLEVEHDLSTDACILVMRNFMNRRGVPKRLRSDNGKNFIGVEGEMRRFTDVFDCHALQSELSTKGVEWAFNCPANPSEGGAWERMVQCVKRVLRHTLKDLAPREYTLHSLLIEAENVVNSRPLTHLPISPDQEEPLTPNHFLLGCANTAQTTNAAEPPLKPCAVRKQWRMARQMRDRFWKRWVAEYLPTLTRRTKWCQPAKPLSVGDLVYICDPNIPRKEWRRGRVEQVFQGADGEIRRVELRTLTGLVQRPASKLAVLDVVNGESGSIHGGGGVAERR